MRPEVVAESFAAVEDEWRTQAREYAECTLGNGTDCSGSPKAFQKSCALVSKAMVGGSGGDNAVVTEYMSYVCNSTKLEGWKKEGCVSFAAADKIMSGDNYYNRNELNVTSLCGTFWAKFSAEEEAREAAEQAAREAEQKKREEEAAAAAKAAAEAAAKAAEEENKADEAKKAEDAKKAEENKAAEAKRVAEESAKKAEEAKAELEQKQKEAAQMAEEAQKKKEEAEKAREAHAKLANHTNASVVAANATAVAQNSTVVAAAPKPNTTATK